MAVNHGKRNLTALGILAVAIVVITTSISLAIYRLSGDIYLDRSRPGYLPDEEEVSQDPIVNNNYAFPESGELTQPDLDKYLEELKSVDERLNNLADPYSPSPLSDESLGIPSEFTEK